MFFFKLRSSSLLRCTLAAAHGSLVGTYGLGAPVLAAGPLGIGKGLIGAAPAVATVSSRDRHQPRCPSCRHWRRRPIALANGLVGNGLIANGLVGNGLIANGLYGNGVLANGVIAGNGILANGLVAGHGIAAPLAVGNGLLGAPTVSELERSVLQLLLDSDSVLERLFIN
ncbi:hypothetical protein CEXT_14141 [Caerostris extrusa]|uniref:Uncharacterized protein n=1 Tax=Caerostris extrusa TaxID=172846 RepID=A0AAV4VPE2_CAEEX|nr:hypothetical protein CEXT_14141 [Caerostris extrusa]